MDAALLIPLALTPFALMAKHRWLLLAALLPPWIFFLLLWVDGKPAVETFMNYIAAVSGDVISTGMLRMVGA